jgi:RNA recognition motif-containing protein
MKHRKRNNESESEDDSQEYESEEDPKITSGVMELKNQESKSLFKVILYNLNENTEEEDFYKLFGKNSVNPKI